VAYSMPQGMVTNSILVHALVTVTTPTRNG
jgi:hypothetical protein